MGPFSLIATFSTHSQIFRHNLQFGIWDYYLLFLIAVHVVTKLLLNET